MWAGRKRRVELLAKALASFPAQEVERLGELAELLQQLIRSV
jgi:hypothetical protein